MIAVDAMGGDHAPRAVVHGAVRAAQKGVPILLFGDQNEVTGLLQSIDPKWRQLPIEIEHCIQAIAMDEEPSRAVVQKKDASLVRAAHAVAQGRAQALVSAGNSGAVLVASTLIIGRVQGVLRPAVGGFLPTHTDSVFCLDLGANTDCKVEFLEQFALMGHAYVNVVKKIAMPRIGLLSNGHEPYKGSGLVKQAYDRIEKLGLHFIGNLEPRDVFDGRADVIVCDGFVGNILLKSIQGTAQALLTWLKDEAQSSLARKFLLWLNRGIFKKIKTKTDYATRGGALLLGVKQPVVFAHGRSHARAIENALLFAHQVVEQGRVRLFNDHLRILLEKRTRISSVVSQKVRSLLAWKQT